MVSVHLNTGARQRSGLDLVWVKLEVVVVVMVEVVMVMVVVVVDVVVEVVEVVEVEEVEVVVRGSGDVVE